MTDQLRLDIEAATQPHTERTALSDAAGASAVEHAADLTAGTPDTTFVPPTIVGPVMVDPGSLGERPGFRVARWDNEA